jgi:cytochrome c oxidase accessory protein FixG
VVATQLLFYGLPWLTWNARPAVLFDLASRKFYILGMVLWPQVFIFLAGLLVISALSLFLFTAVGGRLFCGYACPQTVYTEIFLWIERKIEGDRARRMRLDGAALDADKLLRKTVKHLLWLCVGLWTGITFVGYFTPIRTLLGEVISLSPGPWETFWMLFYGFATYGNAGWMREQVCKYMCPYARFQSAMFDPDTLIITYDAQRGEPRGSRARSTDYKAKGLGACVDCGICVQVCPTGIDIRRGLQYECIGCAACVDGCNQVMDKMGYPRGLIRYSTQNALKQDWTSSQMAARVFRPRVLVYIGLLLLIVTVWSTALALRSPLKVDVIRDRAALMRETREGKIENVYRLQIMNTDEQAHRYVIKASGLNDMRVTPFAPVSVAGATTQSVVVTLEVDPARNKPGSHSILFQVEDMDQPATRAIEKSRFIIK